LRRANLYHKTGPPANKIFKKDNLGVLEKLLTQTEASPGATAWRRRIARAWANDATPLNKAFTQSIASPRN
jgi:hypothetical protein